MKKIEDVIHLYLGCFPLRAVMPDGIEVIIFGWYYHSGIKYAKCIIQDSRHPQNGEEISYVVSGLKIVLRRLESMTEEEKRQMLNECQFDTGVEFAILEARKTLWYLSKGFDLFSLIPEGLAIDKSTLK